MFCLLLLAALTASPSTVRQGGTIHVRSAEAAASARMNGRTVRMFAQPDGEWLGLMPVPAAEKPGPYQLELLDGAGKVLAAAPVAVRDARFPVQNVVMSKATTGLQPSAGEMETVAAFRNTVTDERHWQEPLAAPVPGCVVSPFGVQRWWNGKPTGNYHAGFDQRSQAGRPVHAVAAGVVRIVKQFNIHGGTVAVDHGQGLESIYLHLSKFAVAEGAAVKRGDVVGYVGSTGRSTAPHLHWSLYVNGVPVNPAQWLTLPPCRARRPARRGR